jgi:RNA polymerase sigma-70 factor (ECF subfamily)
MVPTTEPRSPEADLIDRLRTGDEATFVCLVETFSASLKRLALAFVSTDAVAEEVVQETWLAVLTGITRFEGRSSVKTWIFKILTNRAKTRAIRERRTINFSELEDPKEPGQPAVDPARFLPADHPTHPGHWASPPEAWSGSAEDAVVAHEMMGVLQRELERLPPAQRVVVALRDVHGWPAAEVCDVLGLSEANQRVLLHRGRSRLRGVMEAYFAENA